MLVKALIVFLGLFLLPGYADSTTFYVKKTGSNSNSCVQAQNPSTPKLTIGAGVACTTGDNTDIVDVDTGTYTESNFNVPASTSYTTGITIRKSSGATVTLTRNPFNFFGFASAYVTIDGLIFDGQNGAAGAGQDGINIAIAHHIRIRNFTVRGFSANGVQVGSSNNEFSNCTIEDVGTSDFDHGFYINNTGDGSGANNVVEGCSITRYSGAGIQAYQNGNGTILRNNRIFKGGGGTPRTANTDTGGFTSGFRGWGIICYPGTCDIYNNVIYDLDAGAGGVIGIQIDTGNQEVYSNTIFDVQDFCVGVGSGSGHILRNNVLAGCGQVPIYIPSATGTFSNNLSDQPDVNISIVADPRFADPVNGDFRLCTAAGVPHASCAGASPALNVGATLGAPYNVDITGTARPQGAAYDLGAYESSAAPPGPACPTTPALVGQYSFDGAATDSSGNSNNASLGTGVTYVSGRYNQGVQFPGDAGITVARSDSLFLCTGLTIAMWVQLPSTVSDFRALVASNYGSTDDGWFLYAGSTGYAQAGAPIGGYCIGDCGSQYGIAVYGVNLTTAWTHVALTWDNSLSSANIKLFIDGTQVTSASGTATLADWTGDMCIGCSPFGEYLPNTTVVDEVRIYNYARSGAQILTDMNTPIGALGSTVSFKVGPGITKKIGPGITEKFGMAP